MKLLLLFIAACAVDQPERVPWRCAFNYSCGEDVASYSIVPVGDLTPEEGQEVSEGWARACQAITAAEVESGRCVFAFCAAICRSYP